MSNLRKHLVPGLIGAAMLLGMFVATSNAQYRRSGYYVTYGQPYSTYTYRTRRRYYRPRSYTIVREYRPVYYRTYYRTYPRYSSYNNAGYYYGRQRRWHRRHSNRLRNTRYVYRDTRYW
jgi:hypothetical protein